MAAKDGVYQDLSVLSEPLRMRLLRLLARQELAVGELSRIVQTAQSTVSRHLKSLLNAGWVAKRTEGTASFYRQAELPEAKAKLLKVVDEQADEYPEDLRRLEAVVAMRRAEGKGFFGRVAGQWDAVRQELFGDGFLAPATLALVDPEITVADLGCGTGSTLELLAPACRRAIGVDREQAMLDAAGERLSAYTHVELRSGTLADLPLKDDEVDAALFFLVLHHVEDVPAALSEAARAVRPGGRIVVVDMVAHDREEYRLSMGHEHLGFGRSAFEGMVTDAGLSLDRYVELPPEPDAQGPGLFLGILTVAGAKLVG